VKFRGLEVNRFGYGLNCKPTEPLAMFENTFKNIDAILCKDAGADSQGYYNVKKSS
tara:strand:- start:927 stop:1094 length:168 start_codon:yes stop_codon:yes gene_type:complete